MPAEYGELSKRRALACLLLLGVGMLAACVPNSAVVPIEAMAYPLPEGYLLFIDLDHAFVELTGQSESLVSITGTSLLEGAGLVVEMDDSGQVLSIHSGQDAPSESQLVIGVPSLADVDLRLGRGSVRVSDLEGTLSIQTISAPILISRFSGIVLANSRRGSIEISASQGTIDALAEADTIRFLDVRGEVTGTNIMGAIEYRGTIETGDSVRLETDHGAVRVNLHEVSDVDISVSSAGGSIVCTLPGHSGTREQCEGAYGQGAGQLWIRTVSGAINLGQ